MRVLFSMHGEAGHHLGTFRLARHLQSLGHDVTYLGLPRVRRLVEDQGFAFIEFAGDLLSPSPAGAASQQGVGPSPGPGSRRRSEEALFRRYTSAIVDGTLDDSLISAAPDVLLCDTFLWYVALRALRLQIPIIQISTSLFLYDNPLIPPAVTSLQPRDGVLSRLQVSLAWKSMHLKHWFTKRMASLLIGSYRAPLRMHHLTGTFHWVARRSGIACRRNTTYVVDEIGAHLILPEIVFCTASFQFPGPLPRERLYCGDFIDGQRQEEPLPFDPAGRTIILCSLGTSAGSYREAARFFSAVAEASRLEPAWFFVLHISDPELLGAFETTANLLVLPWIPQLTVLRHAAVMVNHGGLNSIMECVQSTVPMVILPCVRDQPGNAARAAFHQLALTADIQTISGRRLKQSIASAIHDPTLKAGLKRMKQQIDQEHGLQRAVALIESVAEP